MGSKFNLAGLKVIRSDGAEVPLQSEGEVATQREVWRYVVELRDKVKKLENEVKDLKYRVDHLEK